MVRMRTAVVVAQFEILSRVLSAGVQKCGSCCAATCLNAAQTWSLAGSTVTFDADS
jgi:hypothetical protein